MKVQRESELQVRQQGLALVLVRRAQRPQVLEQVRVRVQPQVREQRPQEQVRVQRPQEQVRVQRPREPAQVQRVREPQVQEQVQRVLLLRGKPVRRSLPPRQAQSPRLPCRPREHESR